MSDLKTGGYYFGGHYFNKNGKLFMIEAVGMTYFRLKSVGKVGAPTYSYENVSSIKDNYIEANKILMYLYGYKNYYLKNKAKFISN